MAAEAAAAGGVGLSDVVQGLGPGVVCEEGEAGADTLVDAEIHPVVLGGAVAGIDLGQILIEEVLVGKQGLHQAFIQQSVALHDAPWIRLLARKFAWRLNVGNDVTELWSIQRSDILQGQNWR